MKLGNAVWSAWKSASDATRLCLATATAAFGIAGCGAIYNQFFDGHFAAGGMFFVGWAYLALALLQGAWQARHAAAGPTPSGHPPSATPQSIRCQPRASLHAPANQMVERKHS